MPLLKEKELATGDVLYRLKNNAQINWRKILWQTACKFIGITGQEKKVEITHTFGVEEAHEIISRAGDDYRHRFENLELLLREV